MLSAMALTILTPAIVTTIPTEAATFSKTFKDVSKNNTYYDIIHTMAQQGIISGYEDGTFKPSQTITRKHAAALISRAVKDLPKTTSFKAPKDLSTNNAYYSDIKKLMEAGVLELDSKGNINPNAPLTRGEMAKILTVSYDLSKTGAHPLKDVSNKYYQYVAALYQADVTTGFEDGTFRENGSLTRAHYAVFMYRAEAFKAKKIDLDSLTESEVSTLTDSQIAQLIPSYQYTRITDMPLPNGYTDRDALTSKLDKAYRTYWVQTGIDRNTNKLAYLADTRLSDYTKTMSNILQMSQKDFIKLMRDVYLTGELITNNENDSVIYAAHFNYSEGRFVLGYKMN